MKSGGGIPFEILTRSTIHSRFVCNSLAEHSPTLNVLTYLHFYSQPVKITQGSEVDEKRSRRIKLRRIQMPNF
jgi:hypothetical protein